LALRTLTWLETHRACYREMDARARRLAAGIAAALRRLALDYAVVQLESIVDFKFRPGPATRNYDDARRADAAAFAAYYHALRRRGVLLAPSQNEVMFLSTAHSDDDIAVTLDAIETALGDLCSAGVI
jgi:glutamate-1-semialdehyde 2,1-aminomutase